MLYTPDLPTFTNHFYSPTVIDARSGGSFVMRAVQANIDLGIGLTPTPMWVYELVDATTGTVMSSMPGMVMPGMPMTGTGIYNPTFLTRSNVPVTITWANDLPPGDHLLPYDPSILMGMDMMGTGIPFTINGQFMTPIVTHLHGAHVAAIYDGYPENTIIPGQQTTYTYDNTQPGALLWYHDHSIGLTRLNVYAGLAGLYMIEDANRERLVAEGVLPALLGTFEKAMVIQDKAFNTDGTLYYPAYPDDVLPGTTDTVADVVPPDYVQMGGQFPTAVPEFFGNTILVNGRAWPHMHVGQGEVMLDLLNGSDSRFYTLQLDNAFVKVTLVGVDGGLLEKPIVIMDGDGVQEEGEQIIFAPADRLQVVFDFSKVASGDDVTLINKGAAYEPFKGLNSDGTLAGGVQVADPAIDPIGSIVSFGVVDTTPAFHSTLTENTVLNPDYQAIDPATATVTRKLGIFEVTDEFGRIMPQVGIAETMVDQTGATIDAGGLGWDKPATEIVQLDPVTGKATEVWEFYNVTADAHPIHLHQIQFQVLGRYSLTEITDPNNNAGDLNQDGVVLEGEALYNNDLGKLIDTRADLPGIQNLRPEDMGDQDTVWVGPGEGIKIIMTFDRPGDYLWHCHILSHEDHDMMRTIKVLGVTGDFTGMIAEDSNAPASGLIEIGTLDDSLQGFQAGVIHGQYGMLTMSRDGNWSYAADNASTLVQSLNLGETVNDVITVRELGGATHDITIEVIGRNDAPVFRSGDSAIAERQANISVPVYTASAIDVDLGSVLTYSIGGGADADQFVIDAITGEIRFRDGTHLSSIVDANADGIFQITVRATDDLNAAATQDISIKLANDNNIHVLSANGDTYNGTAQFDWVKGLGGNDVISGAEGNDYLDGNAGDDLLKGGAGADQLIGSQGT